MIEIFVSQLVTPLVTIAIACLSSVLWYIVVFDLVKWTRKDHVWIFAVIVLSALNIALDLVLLFLLGLVSFV